MGAGLSFFPKCQKERPAPHFFVLPAGTLDEDAFLEPKAHIYCASRSSWEDKVKDLKRFDELPNEKG